MIPAPARPAHGGRAPDARPNAPLPATGRLVAILAAAAWALPAAGQTVTGEVVDADHDRAIAGATVILVDALSATVDSVVSDSTGRFRLTAPAPGSYIVHVSVEGHLSYSSRLELAAGRADTLRIEMPLISTRAARVMNETIRREAAFQLPWEELCGEPVRPWEAGVLVGVSRDRGSMEPIPRAVVRAETVATDSLGAGTSGDDRWERARVATAAGSFWFCNVPPGRVRMVARADGFAPDTSHATIRAGTISWYDALLRPAR